MTREEAIKFLALVKVAYPTAYKDMDKESKLATVNMWHSTFLNVHYKIIEMAFDHFRRVSKFPPTVADMYEELRRLYYEAVGDANTAYWSGDKEREKLANWVIDHTNPFRSSQDASGGDINYAMISTEDLKVLPYKEERPIVSTELLIGEEVDDEAL